LVILAMGAGEVAADCGNGPRAAAGQDVIHRFFLHRIGVFRHQAAINQGMQAAVPILPHTAAAPAARPDPAAMSAELAGDCAVLLAALQ
jgi:hypothetical protein